MIELNKRYIKRSGEMSGLIVENTDPNEVPKTYPFIDQDSGLSYTNTGRLYLTGIDLDDLMEVAADDTLESLANQVRLLTKRLNALEAWRNG